MYVPPAGYIGELLYIITGVLITFYLAGRSHSLVVRTKPFQGRECAFCLLLPPPSTIISTELYFESNAYIT